MSFEFLVFFVFRKIFRIGWVVRVAGSGDRLGWVGVGLGVRRLGWVFGWVVVWLSGCVVWSGGCVVWLGRVVGLGVGRLGWVGCWVVVCRVSCCENCWAFIEVLVFFVFRF